MEKTLKRFKIANWLMILGIAYLAAEMIYCDITRSQLAPQTFFPLNTGGKAWTFGWFAGYGTILVLLVQMILGFTKVLKKRKGGIVCYVLFYVVMGLMLLVQNLWYDGAWLRYIPIVIVLLISGFQGDCARNLCKKG